MPAPWQARVSALLARWRDAGVGETWVVAVSGGGDSVGLLRFLCAEGPGLGLRLSVAHLDHGARGEASRADAAFVAGLAEGLGLPFDLGHWRPTRPGHFEADARRARYAWLAEVARARGASAVAVGHTKDDQAETILHRIVRGTGPRGLAGMPARRRLDGSASLVRPFLGVTRREVRASLDALGQPFRDDASNEDPSRTRARIRHDLLPRLAAEYNPAVAEALVRLGLLAGASDRILRSEVLRIGSRATLWSDGTSMGFDRRALWEVPAFLRAEVLRAAWRRAGWPESAMGLGRWERVAALAGSPRARASVGEGIEAVTTPRELILRREGPPPAFTPPGAVALPVPGEALWRGGRLIASLDPAAGSAQETIDRDGLVPPLEVRAPRDGDRFDPLGMRGSMALNDFFRGRRVPKGRRPSIPLVCDARGIVWVVGHRIAHRARLTEATARTVGLRWEGGGAAGCG